MVILYKPFIPLYFVRPFACQLFVCPMPPLHLSLSKFISFSPLSIHPSNFDLSHSLSLSLSSLLSLPNRVPSHVIIMAPILFIYSFTWALTSSKFLLPKIWNPLYLLFCFDCQFFLFLLHSLFFLLPGLPIYLCPIVFIHVNLQFSKL